LVHHRSLTLRSLSAVPFPKSPVAKRSCTWSPTYRIVVAPLVAELTSDNTAIFHFIDGNCGAVPPEGFEEFFGKPPYYRFIEPDDKDKERPAEDVLTRIRDFPECETPEQTMRELMREGVADSRKSTDTAMNYLFKVMEEQGPFDGIIGYSEGATVAATLLLKEQFRKEEQGIEPMFKCAIFFMGWPPLDPKTYFLVLSDQSERVIDIPTCHISEFLLSFKEFTLRDSLRRRWGGLRSQILRVRVRVRVLTALCSFLTAFLQSEVWILISTDQWRYTILATRTLPTSLTRPRGTLCQERSSSLRSWVIRFEL
jgi:hypothetical protein